MRRLLLLAAVSAGLSFAPGPAGAQLSTDQLNKLSLEALTAPPPRRAAPVVHHAVGRPFRRSYAGRHFVARHARYQRVHTVQTRSSLGRPSYYGHETATHRLARR